MYIAVCDDQTAAVSALAELINKWQNDRRTTVRCRYFHDAAEMLSAAETERFTVYLLDVVMPGLNGIEAARKVRAFDDSAEIVFLTSSTDFAYDSYGVRALNYLLKPISEGILFPVLDQIHLREQASQDGLTLKCGAALVRIPFHRLTYVEVNGKHLYFNLTDGSVREVYGTLKEFEPLLLERPEFMQVHRSYIVNMLQVEELSHNGIQTYSGKQVPVSRLLFSQLQQKYMQLLFNREEG